MKYNNLHSLQVINSKLPALLQSIIGGGGGGEKPPIFEGVEPDCKLVNL